MLARLRLECSGVATRLARVPAVGPWLRKIGDRLVPRGTLVWTTIRRGDARGLRVLVDARTGAQLRSGNHELAVQRTLRRCLAPGQVFYDLGANLGVFTLLAARLVGPQGKVVAFEPEPDVADRLRRALERNSLSNVTVVEAAVWSKSDSAVFQRSVGSPDQGVGRVANGLSGERCIVVQTLSLDDFARNAPTPNVIKCDVEGAEVEVFAGARALLSQHRPTVICEVHSAENLGNLEGVFAAAGYKVTALEDETGYPIHILAAAIP